MNEGPCDNLNLQSNRAGPRRAQVIFLSPRIKLAKSTLGLHCRILNFVPEPENSLTIYFPDNYSR